MEPTKNNTQQSESKLHFLDYWRIIRIRKTVILAVFLLVVVTTTVVTYFLPESFVSTARITVEKDTSDIQLLMPTAQSGGYDPYFIQTEFEKIKSQKVLYRVIEELNLNQSWAKRFNAEGKLKNSDTFGILQKQIDVRQARNTSLIEIRAYSNDKNEAAQIANKIAMVYQDSRVDSKKARSRSGIEALKKELDAQTVKVDDAQKTVDLLGKDLNISDGGDAYSLGSSLDAETVRATERDRIHADGELVQLNTLLASFKSKTRGELRKAIPTAFRDDAMDRYLTDLGKAEQTYVTTIQEYADEHPEVLRLVSLMSNINVQVEARIDGVLSGLETMVASRRAQVDSLTQRVEEAKKKDASMREKFRPYFAAKRDLENQAKIRDTIFIRIIQEQVDDKIPKTGTVEIIDEAQPSVKAVRPNIPLNITLGVIVGLIMGFGLAFFIEYLDTSVKTIDDVERALQAPVLGVIPQNVGSILEEGPDSPHAEAYRVLRTNLLFSRKDTNFNTITVVSGGAGEGKSTTIFNLATVFAQNGHKVLLVDSDLRRPSLHKLLNVSNSIGLTNFLLKQNTIDEVVQTTRVPSLNFLPSGKLPSSSLGILNSTQMRDFIQKAKERYDFVFFDSPPIIGVSDASILASEVDMALLVIQYRKYPQVMTIRAKQMVEKVGGNLLGVVLNNINISQDSYYYYYSGYYYDYYSKHDDGDEKSKKNGEGAKPAAPGDRAALDLKKKY